MISTLQTLETLIAKVVKEQGITTLPPVSLTHPIHNDLGDLSTNIGMITFKDLPVSENRTFKNPHQWAEFLCQMIREAVTQNQALANTVKEVTVAGPGFINFWLQDHYFIDIVQQISQNANAVIPQIEASNTAVVEYSSPNIAKPFTIGHLRSTIIGDAVANLLAATGWKVKRDNHLGDWGTQFGKQIYAIKHLGLGSQDANIAAISQAKSPVKLLVDLYVEFHQKAEADPSLDDQAREWFQKLEAGDKEARELWQLCIDWSLAEFQKIYQRMGISFTENPDNHYLGYGESFFEDKMEAVIAELEKVRIAGEALVKESKGAQLVFFPDEKYPPLMLRKKDGATLYATRDLATDRWRLQHYGQGISIINEVGAEQSLYFQQLFETELLAGWFKSGQRVHVKHGMYRFKDKKMSTRKGNVIWLDEVLNEAEKRAQAVSQDITPSDVTKIAFGALKWNDLKRSSHLDVVFDWDEILNLKGNSGPYVQYTFVRASSILRKAQNIAQTNIAKPFDTENTIAKTSLNDAEKTVARWLGQYGEVVQQAATQYAPHHLCTYLYNLSQAFNTFYTDNHVLGEGVPPEKRALRLVLTQAVANVLDEGLGLLGIETVAAM